MELKGKVVLITGASYGIGWATALAFARKGTRLALAARSTERLQALAALVRGKYGVDTLVVPTDLVDRAAVVEMVRRTAETFGRLDVLVNNAGVGVYGSIPDVPDDLLRRSFEVNFFAPIAAIQAAVPIMRQQGGGMLVAVSSIISKRQVPLSGGYSAAKAALNAMANTVRLEVAPYGIRVLTVYPGVTRTSFVQHGLGTPPERGGRISYFRLAAVASPERVAYKIVQGVEQEKRELYITPFDRLAVIANTLFPWLADAVLSRLMARSWR